jgi:2-hydroxychromene-2-carboxylate isomerase
MEFFYDFISPYGYLAACQIESLAAKHGQSLTMTPVLLAAILHHNQQRGPAEIPDKRTYTYKNLIRLAHDLGLPIQPPPGHPFNPLLPLRLATLRPELCLPLFKKCWAEGKAIDQKEQLQSWLPCEWLDECQSPAVKEKLRLNTERAISLGVFGVPSMVVKNEVFWGFDSFPHLERFLQGKDPVTAEQVAQWRDLPVAASRF